MRNAGRIRLALAIILTVVSLSMSGWDARAESIAEAEFAELVATGEAGKVVYAETPSAQVIPVGVPPVPQMIVRSPLAVLDKEVLQSHGRTVASEGRSFHYVPPLEAGSAIEGVFIRQGGGGITIGSTTVTKSETLTFVFDRNGRYSMAKDTDVAIAAANAGGGAGSNDSAAGRYHLAGYALELHPEQGAPMRLPFFVYTIDPFWPNSDSSGNSVNALNLGSELFYRDTGEK